MKIQSFVIMLTVIFGFFLLDDGFTASGQISTGGPIRVSPYQFSQLASFGNNVYALYQQNNDNGIGYHVFFTKSSDAGKSFDNPIDLGSAVEPVVSVFGNNVFLGWESGFTGWPPSHVLFTKSTDGGNTFSKAVTLDNDSNSSSVITQLLSDGKHLFAVIDELGEKPPYPSDVYLMTSQDNGTTWGNKVELLPSAISNENPLGYGTSIQQVKDKLVAIGEKKLDCKNPNLCQYAIFLRASTDHGSSFGPELDIAKAWEPTQLQMVSSDNNIYVIWIDGIGGKGPSLFFSKSNDGGNTFSSPIALSQNQGESDWPHMVADGKSVYIIWQYNNENLITGAQYYGQVLPAYVSGIFFTKSADGGNTFSEPLKISGDIGTSYFSGITISNGNIYAAWISKHGDTVQTFFSKSKDNGTTFDNPVDLTGGSDTWFSEIDSSDDNVYIAGSAFSGNMIWLKASNDNGADFGPLVNLNNDTNVPTFVSILNISLCCTAENPWFQNGWFWTGVAVSAVIGSWFFVFRRLKEYH